MGMSKTEVNLRRLLAAAPQQQNQAKLAHYVATLRELLEQLVEEKSAEGLPRVLKAKVNEYSEKIEEIASKLIEAPLDVPAPSEISVKASVRESPTSRDGDAQTPSSPTLRRRLVPASSAKSEKHGAADGDASKVVKLDAAAQTHIDKHRKLQEDLTDDMVVLARQLKESSLMISQSVENTTKLLDSTEEAIEQSLASTGHANVRAAQIYGESSKTTCLQWLLIFAMTCVFIMVVLLIRVT